MYCNAARPWMIAIWEFEDHMHDKWGISARVPSLAGPLPCRINPSSALCSSSVDGFFICDYRCKLSMLKAFCSFTCPHLGAELAPSTLLDSHSTCLILPSAFSCTFRSRILGFIPPPMGEDLHGDWQLMAQDGSFPCRFCSSSYASVLARSDHEKQHTDKEFKCLVCGKSFISTWNLQRHQDGVHRRKMHTCSKCQKSFTQADSLHRHKKYSCT